MAGLLDTLGTARRGLNVAQNGIAIAGHNIANVNTPGYSRQRAVVETSLPISTGAGTIGSGAEQVSVQRIVEQFTQVRLVRETSTMGALSVAVDAFRDVESIVNDQLGPGLTDDLDRFFGSVDALGISAVPGQPVARQQLLSDAQNLVNTIHRYDQQLRDLQRSSDHAVTGILPEINSLAQGIADLNQKIFEAEAIAPANDLRDQRDQLILELAEKVELTTLESSNGQLSVRIGGGNTIVDGSRASQLVAVVDPANPNPFDPTFSRIFLKDGANLFDVTSSLQGGEIGGHLDARNNIISGAIRELDAFAFSLSEAFNGVHQGGLGLIDGASHNFFSDLSTQTSVDNSARLLSLSADIDPNQGGDLRNIAAGTNAVAGGVGQAAIGDTTHVSLLSDLSRQAVTNYLAGDVPGSPTGSPISLSSKLIGSIREIGIGTRSAVQAEAQQESIMTAVRNRRDGVSGVNMDEEVAALVQLQASFQANSRVISTVNRLLDDLLNAL